MTGWHVRVNQKAKGKNLVIPVNLGIIWVTGSMEPNLCGTIPVFSFLGTVLPIKTKIYS